jgi:dTMP kinase
VALNGVFITLEGPDGAGKSSQAQALADRLRAEGLMVVLTREPGGTDLGEQVRQVLLHARDARRDALAEAALFSAARRQLVVEVVRPALERGEWVVCDRFADSTLAYQGHGAGAPLDALRRLAEVVTGGLQPDRTLLFDIPVEQGLDRRAGGPAADLTRFETADDRDVAFHQRVRDGYLALAAAEPERWRVIDASAEPEDVAAAAWDAVADMLSDRR